MRASGRHACSSKKATPWLQASAQHILPIALMVALALCGPVSASAQTVGFTDIEAFQTAIDEHSRYQIKTISFDEIATTKPLTDGASVGPLTFHHDIGGVDTELAVTTGLPTTSGDQFLGLHSSTVQDRQIQHGDEFEIDFHQTVQRSAHALGVTLVVGDPLKANDIRLETDNGGIGNAGNPTGTTSDGGHIYFLGLTSDRGMQRISVTYGHPDEAVAFLYTMDDLQLAIAEPAPISVLGIGGLVLLVLSMATLGAAGLGRRVVPIDKKQRSEQ